MEPKIPRFVFRRDTSDQYEYRYEIFDTKTQKVIGQDGGEPEDQTFTRDWYWVLPALNALAEGEDPRGD